MATWDVAPEGATHETEGMQVRRLRVKFRRGDFARARLGGPYDVVVISLALHQVKRSAGLRVLRAARAALGEGGRLFLLVKLTRDRYFQRMRQDPIWERVPGERNTWRRPRVRAKRGLGRLRWPRGPGRDWMMSALTPAELKAALRGLKVRHYREVVLRSEWDESEPVTHHVAEVVAEK